MKTERVKRKFALFYSAYFLKCLEERLWWFCLIASLAELGSLGYLAGEQLLEGLLQVVASAYIGTMIDRCSRRRGVIAILLLNNFTLFAAMMSLIVCHSLDFNSSWSKILLFLTMLFSILNRLFLNAEKSILGKDWLLVIKGQTKLSSLNWWLQFIDQTASVLSPVYAGWALTEVDSKEKRTTSIAGLWLLGVTLVFTMSGRWILVELLYNSNPKLASPKEATKQSRTHSSALKIFYRQKSFLAAFGACLLFMTVMGFGSVAIGYATKQRVPKGTIGYLKALAAIMSLGGGGLYAIVERKFGVNTSGIVGLVLHQTFILLVVSSVFVPGSSMKLGEYFESFTVEKWFQEVSKSFNKSRSFDEQPFSWSSPQSNSIKLFLVASAFTLIGQSCLETSIKHIMQMTVPESERNTVFGVQNSISKGFTMLKDLMVIGFQSPAIFSILIFASYVFVTTGHLFYVIYVVKIRVRESRKHKAELVKLKNEEEQQML